MDVEQDIRIYPELDYLMNEEKCDFVFVIDGQRVPALKQVLSLKSRVFRAMFSGLWKESNDNQVTIRDATFENFKSMIKFLHTGHLLLVVDDHKINFIRDMIILAEKYELIRLVEVICDHIKEMLSLDNFDDFCKMTYDLNVKEVIPILKNYMKNNFDAFTRLDIKRLKTIDEWTDQSWLEIVMVEKFKTCVTETNQLFISDFPELDYFMNEDVSDVVFIVQGQRVPAIKQVLALKSMQFRNMFETNEDVKEITLEDTNYQALTELIYFIYTDNMLVDKCIIHLPCLWKLATEYKVYRFVESMAQKVVIKCHNFELIAQSAFNISRQYKSILLFKKLKEFIDNNFKQHFYGRHIKDLKRINVWTDQILFEIIFNRMKQAKRLFGYHSFNRCTHHCQKLVTSKFSSVLEKLNGGDTPMNEQMDITFENFHEKCRLAYETKSESLISNLKVFIDNNFKEFFDKDIDYLKLINEQTDQSLFEIWIGRLKTANDYYTRTFNSHEGHNERYGNDKRKLETFI